MSITEPEPLKPKLNGVAGIITALATLVSAVGVAVVIFMSAQQQATLAKQTAVLTQVEKQGNSVALEQKRVTSVALRLLAEKTGLPEHITKANDAEKVYEEALKQSQK